MSRKTLSQNLWLRRREEDHFFAEAKIDGFRARSAYKLLEIDHSYNFIESSSIDAKLLMKYDGVNINVVQRKF